MGGCKYDRNQGRHLDPKRTALHSARAWYGLVRVGSRQDKYSVGFFDLLRFVATPFLALNL